MIQGHENQNRNQDGRRSRRHALMAGAAAASLLAAAQAQEATGSPAEEALDEPELITDEIIVQGIRQTVRDSIEVKREADVIVDALSADDIGDLPALSIGEALETLTGAASHREQGGATEIAVRGLGPYLGSTVINGREAANGSGDRSVNFSQFPSELFNQLAIYKTQSASMIEGGVSGQISLSTLRPIDYGKERVQAELKGNYNPDNAELNQQLRDLGYRATVSYVNNWETEGAGTFGLSVGYQKNASTNPEQEARSSSSFRDCRNVVSGDPDSDNFGIDSLGDRDQNCDSGGGDLSLEVDPDTGVAADADTPFVLTTSQRSFRQNITEDDRESIFLAGQWQPNDRIDVNVDYQDSDRTFTELRSDLTVDANSILNLGEDGELVPLSVLPSGALRGFTTFDGAEVSAQFVERIEAYQGYGASVAYEVTDRLAVSVDYAYSDTSRRENIIQSRLRSNTDDDSGSEDVLTGIVIEDDAQRFVFQDFDVTEPNSFTAGPRVREDLNQFRNNTITAWRGDVAYQPADGLVTELLAGIRFSTLEYDSVPRVRTETDGPTASAACIRSGFPENDFLGAVADGTLITNVDENGQVIAAGTGASYVNFDPICLATALLGRAPAIPDANPRTLRAVDVEEDTMALYLQANYESQIGALPVRGNVGVRFVDTEVTSRGFRGDLSIVRDTEGLISLEESGELAEIEAQNAYNELLPSFNIVADLRDDVLLRGGIFRALSRPDPSDLGLGRDFSTDVDGDFTDLADVIAEVRGFGNPRLGPLMSWNYDAAAEWYPNEDSILSVGLYYKSFNGGFENVAQLETFTVDGEDLQALVTTNQVSDEENTIFGVELTAAHSFTYLPQPLDGLGFKVSYNYANSDFEFEDANFGAATQIASDGTEIERVGIVAPANVPGLSEHVLSAQLYYSIGDLDLQGVYKYRSAYFQQFINTPGNLRFIDDTGVYEARASYQITDNIRASVEAINIFDEPRVQYNPTRDSFAEVNVYGPRVFFGLRGKF